MHMALSIHNCREGGKKKGKKTPNKLGGMVIQGEIFSFRMKHASVLSVGPEG